MRAVVSPTWRMPRAKIKRSRPIWRRSLIAAKRLLTKTDPNHPALPVALLSFGRVAQGRKYQAGCAPDPQHETLPESCHLAFQCQKHCVTKKCFSRSNCCAGQIRPPGATAHRIGLARGLHFTISMASRKSDRHLEIDRVMSWWAAYPTLQRPLEG